MMSSSCVRVVVHILKNTSKINRMAYLYNIHIIISMAHVLKSSNAGMRHRFYTSYTILATIYVHLTIEFLIFDLIILFSSVAVGSWSAHYTYSYRMMWSTEYINLYIIYISRGGCEILIIIWLLFISYFCPLKLNIKLKKFVDNFFFFFNYSGEMLHTRNKRDWKTLPRLQVHAIWNFKHWMSFHNRGSIHSVAPWLGEISILAHKTIIAGIWYYNTKRCIAVVKILARLSATTLF